MASIVIRQYGHKTLSEPFDTDKLAASIEAACLAVNLPDGLAEDAAKTITKTVELWLNNKPEVTSEDIRRVSTQSLTIISPEAAYLYKHHHTIL